MAEAMELDLTLKKIVDETIKNPIVPPDLEKNNKTNEEAMNKITSLLKIEDIDEARAKPKKPRLR